MTWLYALPLLLVGALCWAVIGRDLWRYMRRRNRRVSRSAWSCRSAHSSFWAGDNRGKTECR